MNPFHRREFLRGFTALAGASLLPDMTRIAQAQLQAQATTQPLTPAVAPQTQIARGRVLLDTTGTGKPAANAKGVPNVRVSNGREVVSTDAQGRYQIPVIDDTIIFIQKPAGYRVPLNELNLPQFYYIHKPLGTQRKARFDGIAPTGPLPASVDFTLIKQAEPDDFRVVLWGDPQVRDIKEIDYVARDVANDLAGVEAAFGMSLGDNVFNKLGMFRPLQDVTASIGIPWHSIIGNHDLNLDAPDENSSAETFKRHFGPTYYSFDYGQTHFVALDNIMWLGAGTEKGNGNYRLGFGEQQLEWLKNDLAGVPADKLVVLFMHIPINRRADDRQKFLDLLKNHPRSLSISGHTHVQSHAFLGRRDGWNGRVPHHHFNCGTVSGSWWSGHPDETGIPHTTMGDGTPNGYAFLNVNKAEYTIDWRCARSSPDYQMNVTVPAQIEVTKLNEAQVKVNFFNGSEKTVVEGRIGNGAWTKMERITAPDPGYAALKAMEESIPSLATDAPEALKKQAPWLALPPLGNTPHLWQMPLPQLPVAAHWVEIRVTDQWNRTFQEKHLIQIV